MKARLLECEIPGCGRLVSIRSTVKKGEHKGKKACPGCKSNLEGKVTPRKRLKPFTDKTRAKRKAERSGLPKFFEDAIKEVMGKPQCVNCGCALDSEYNPHWNVAHILPKSFYKSVMAHPLNFIILCTSKDSFGEACHERFDSDRNGIPNMRCFGPAKERFNIFKEEVVERGVIFTIFEENN